MTNAAPPKLPIPTAFGWFLFESVFGGSLQEKIAQMGAHGADLAGQDEAKAFGTIRRNLRLWSKGRKPRPATLAKIYNWITRAFRHQLLQHTPDDPDAAERIFERFATANGPFAALAAINLPPSLNSAQQNLLDYSDRLDRLGIAFTAAAEADDLEHVKDIFLGANWLDEAYWWLPEDGQDNPRRNRETLRTAENWAELWRACSPLMVNTSLSWLSMLDLATLAGGRYEDRRFPLFLPLATRFTPSAAGAVRDGRALPPGNWSDWIMLPVPNLIRTLKNISAEIDKNIQKRANSWKFLNKTKGEREHSSGKLQDIGRYDLLSIMKFNDLLDALGRDVELRENEGCGFDVYALHIAANLFSLLTPRDGVRPTNKIRRKTHKTITVFDFVPQVYETWWHRNQKDLAGNVVEHPRPDWYIRSLGDNAD